MKLLANSLAVFILLMVSRDIVLERNIYTFPQRHSLY